MTENKADSPDPRKSLRESVRKSLLNNKVAILGAIFVVLFLSQFLKFSNPDLLFWGIPMALLAIGFISWLKNVGWEDVGLSRPESWSNTIKIALIAMVIVQIIGTIQFFFSSSPQDLSTYQDAMSPGQLLIWIVIAWTTAGFGEEVIYRGFYMKQIARLFGEQERWSWVIGLVISSIIFGLVHFHQGPGGMLGNGFAGFVYGIFYLRSERNLWVPIIAHGLTGSISFLILYFTQLL